MAYFMVTAGIILLLGAVVIREMVQQSKRRKAFRQSLYDRFGEKPQHKYTVENSQHIPGYYTRHLEDGQIDDITWNDLNMDEIYRRINYSLSATGEEYLYYLLRSPGKDRTGLQHFEQLVDWFAKHADDRVDMQMQLRELGYTGKHSLYDYIENLDALGERRNRKHHLMNVMYLPFLAMAPFYFSVAVAGISVLGIWQIVSYFKDKRMMEPYIISFAYIMRLINSCEKISGMQIPSCQTEFTVMRECIRKMKGIRRGSFWVFTASDSRTSGNPLELILDYLRMMFHVDLIIFNRMVKQLRLHVEDTDRLITQAGLLEAAISVSWFRASLVEGYCLPEFTDCEGHAELLMEEGYHVMLEHPVKNGIHAYKGVLLTGSNASGKSTFLKMIAVNALLAQTVHTCAAKTYRAPFYRIYSSMALRDDLAGGESYYIVEIKALKRILDAVQDGQRVLCFVDEVLRGTNTVERIAASTQILKSLSGQNVLCVAATHDIELTELLKAEFDNYHFEEEIKNGDISFAYRLMEGKATTRNAIRLLELIGYSEEITENAFTSANQFMNTGVWKV